MFKKFHQFSAVLAICVCASSTFADQAPNPRSAVSANTNSGRVNATEELALAQARKEDA